MTRSSPHGIAPLLLLSALTTPACTGAPPPDDALIGVLGEDIVDRGDSVSHRYWLRPPSGPPIDLHFAQAPELPPGTPVAVWGAPASSGRAFEVTRLEERSDGVAAHRSPLIDGAKRPTLRWAFVLVDTGSGVNLTKESARTKLFSASDPTSIRSWYREVSFGIQDIEGEVFGPLKYPQTDCDENDLTSTLRPMVEGTFDQYLWYLGRPLRTCDWAGIGTLGTAVRPARDSWYNGDAGCDVVIQEAGHNFGMLHSSSMRCTVNGTPVPFSASPQQDCRHNEYGNPFDPMGDGCFHTNGYQKSYLDWISGCNVVTAKSSGVFTLFPLEQPCAGPQLLQIPMPVARPYRAVTTGIPERMSSLTNYYLELRTPVGWDTQLSPRVLVTIGGALKEARRSGGRNWLLDMKPSTTTRSDAALAVGQTFADPDANGPRFTVLSADATRATIRVELPGGSGEGAADTPGMGECDDGTLITAGSDTTCAAAPTPMPTPDGGAARDSGARSDGGAPRDAAPDTARDTAPPARADAAADAAADTSPPADAGSATGSPDARRAADTRPAAPGESEPDAASPPGRSTVGGRFGCAVGGAVAGGDDRDGGTAALLVLFTAAALGLLRFRAWPPGAALRRLRGTSASSPTPSRGRRSVRGPSATPGSRSWGRTITRT